MALASPKSSEKLLILGLAQYYYVISPWARRYFIGVPLPILRGLPRRLLRILFPGKPGLSPFWRVLTAN